MEWALITGASAGIGYALSHQFVRAGHSVVLVARRRAQLEDLARELRAFDPAIRVEVVVSDLAASGAAQHLCSELASRGITIDYLVNNAGFGSSGRFDKLPLARELQMIDLNVRVLVELTGMLVPKMIERRSGKILNVGSMAGFQPGPFMATYYASKAFVNSFSEALSEELKGTGVSVTVLAPGPVSTEFGEVANMGSLRKFEKLTATAEEVAKYGYAEMMKGTPLAISSPAFVALAQMHRILPRALTRKVVAKANRRAGDTKD